MNLSSAFMEMVSGKDGLIHVSELADPPLHGEDLDFKAVRSLNSFLECDCGIPPVLSGFPVLDSARERFPHRPDS
jgi:hypothetical protein